MRAMLARVVLALVAVLVLAWVGVLLRDERIGQSAADRVLYGPPLPPDEFARQLERLEDAELLSPDSRWAEARAGFLLRRDQPAAARAAEALLRDEPANIDVWVTLYEATKKSDPRRAAQALAEIRRLDPRPRPRRATERPGLGG